MKHGNYNILLISLTFIFSLALTKFSLSKQENYTVFAKLPLLGEIEVQNIKTDSGEPLYIELVNQMHSWGDHNNIMFVVGATRTKEMAYIRKKAPDHFFLVPGIGAQGGDIDMVCQSGLNRNCGLLINVSRSIIYAGSGKGFENDVRVASYNIQQKMESILREHQVI